MRTILAADAGGTKTRAVLLDEKNHIISTAVTGAGNPTLDYDGAVANIVKAVLDCKKEETPCAVVLGASGASAVAERLQAELAEKLRLPVYVTTDSILSVFAALGPRNGLVVISGTGSIVQGKKDGSMSRVGGWGHLLGEYGSGASIGYRILTVLAEAIDAEEDVSVLQAAVFERLGVQNRSELTHYVYNRTKADVAVLADVVEQFAAVGERHAQAVLRDEANRLAEHTALLYRRLGFTTEEIHMTGGCITHNTRFREQYLTVVRELLPNADLRPEPVCAENGAWAYWHDACEQEGNNV